MAGRNCVTILGRCPRGAWMQLTAWPHRAAYRALCLCSCAVHGLCGVQCATDSLRPERKGIDCHRSPARYGQGNSSQVAVCKAACPASTESLVHMQMEQAMVRAIGWRVVQRMLYATRHCCLTTSWSVWVAVARMPSCQCVPPPYSRAFLDTF